MNVTFLNMRAGLRQRLGTVVLATTGALTNVSVAGSAYARAAGSFLDDGFAPGDEVVAAGFAAGGNNGRALIKSVSALNLTVDRALVAAAAGPSVTLVSGLPIGRAWEGIPFSPVVGQPFIDESVRPISSDPVGLGSKGRIAHVMTMNLSLCYPAGNVGTNPVERLAGALLDLFQPGTSIVYGASNGVVTKAEQRPLLQDADWLRCPLIITVASYSDRL